MRWVVHGFNLYAVIVLAGFAFFGVGLASAVARYRSWVRRNDAQHR